MHETENVHMIEGKEISYCKLEGHIQNFPNRLSSLTQLDDVIPEMIEWYQVGLSLITQV